LNERSRVLAQQVALLWDRLERENAQQNEGSRQSNFARADSSTEI
jgi:hypothetical protein